MIRYFIQSFKMALGSEMTYRFNFLFRTLTLISFDLIMPLITLLIYMNTKGFPGWTIEQMILFQGIFISINAIDRLFFQQVDWSLSYIVRNGEFDRILLYPVNVLACLSFSNLGLSHLANLFIGTLAVLYGLFRLELVLTFVSVSLFFIYVFFALLLIYSLAIFRYALIIRLIKLGRIGELFRTVKQYGEYPVSIYNAFISSTLKYALPLALIAYYPSKALFESFFEPWPILAVIIFAVLSTLFWKDTLKKYTSAGG